MKDNAVHKELFEEILAIRNEIANLEEEIKQMKNEEMKIFRKKYEHYKLGTAKQMVHYDLINSALFGNCVVV